METKPSPGDFRQLLDRKAMEDVKIALPMASSNSQSDLAQSITVVGKIAPSKHLSQQWLQNSLELGTLQSSGVEQYHGASSVEGGRLDTDAS